MLQHFHIVTQHRTEDAGRSSCFPFSTAVVASRGGLALFGFASWEERKISSLQPADSHELGPVRHAQQASAVAQSLWAL